MISLQKVNPTGYFSFGLSETLDIDNLGITLLDGVNKDRGGSNGSGKSSLFNTICHILFGANPSGETADDVTNAKINKRFGMVYFKDNAGDQWRVIETRKWKKSDKYLDNSIAQPSTVIRLTGGYTGTDVYLERWNGKEWNDERGTNAIGKMKLTTEATREKIVSILNCSYDQFIDTCYLVQQEGLRLVSGKHKDRYEIISRLANTEKWESRRASAYADRLRLEQALRDDESKLAGIQSSIYRSSEIIEQEIALAEAQQLESNEQLKIISMDLALNQGLKVDVDTQTAEWLLKRTAILAVSKEFDTSVQTLVAEKNKLYREYISQVDVVRKAPESSELTQLRSTESLLGYKISSLHGDLNNMVPGEGKCSKCKSFVTLEHIERHRELTKLQIAELEHELTQVRSTITELSEELDRHIDNVISDLDKLYNSIKLELDTLESSLRDNCLTINKEAESCIAKWQESTREASRISALLSKLPVQISQLKMNMSHVSGDIGRLKTELSTVNQVQNINMQIASDILVRQNKIKSLQTVERLFGDRGMQAYVLEQTIGQLNAHIKSNLKNVYNSNIDMWMSCFKEKADGTMGINIQVYVKDGSKESIPFSLYSGGERQILSLVILDAYSALAAKMGSGFNILLLDEIFGPLDGTNAARVFEYVSRMSAKSRSSIFITAHDSTIKDSIKFDTILTVIKSEEITTLAVNKRGIK